MYRQTLTTALRSFAHAGKHSYAAPSRGLATIMCSKHGSPQSVLTVAQDTDVGAPGDGQVLLKMISAPVTPHDLAMVGGVGEVRARLPCAAGLMGVGEVVASGPGAKATVGGKVVVALPGIGTWQSQALAPDAAVCTVPSSLSTEAAAALVSAALPAQLLLDNFTNLQSGDVVVCNGGDSPVGVALVQLAKAMGLKIAAVVSDEAGEEVKAKLTSLGADAVISNASSSGGRAALRELGAAKLAVNLVGGKSTQALTKALGPGGVLVTAGGKARQGVEVSVPALIFNGIEVKGFSLVRWLSMTPPEEKQSAIEVLASKVSSGIISSGIELPTKAFTCDELDAAITLASTEGVMESTLLSL